MAPVRTIMFHLAIPSLYSKGADALEQFSFRLYLNATIRLLSVAATNPGQGLRRPWTVQLHSLSQKIRR
jgi:hypothetical protein